MNDERGLWSNKLGVMPPLSLEVMQEALRRLTVCGICGLVADTGPVKMISGWIAHAECSRGLTDDAYRMPDA